jgi:hypothetical protein
VLRCAWKTPRSEEISRQVKNGATTSQHAAKLSRNSPTWANYHPLLPSCERWRLDAFEAGLLSDLGSEPTAAQRALIDSTRVSLGVCFLANAYLSQDGLSKLKRNRWLLSTLATFINSTRLNLQALGLERKTKDVMTLDSVLADLAATRNAGQNGGRT